MNVNRFLEAMLMFVQHGNGLRISFCKAYLFVHHEKVFLHPRKKGEPSAENKGHPGDGMPPYTIDSSANKWQPPWSQN